MVAIPISCHKRAVLYRIAWGLPGNVEISLACFLSCFCFNGFWFNWLNETFYFEHLWWHTDFVFNAAVYSSPSREKFEFPVFTCFWLMAWSCSLVPGLFVCLFYYWVSESRQEESARVRLLWKSKLATESRLLHRAPAPLPQAAETAAKI